MPWQREGRSTRDIDISRLLVMSATTLLTEWLTHMQQWTNRRLRTSASRGQAGHHAADVLEPCGRFPWSLT